MYELKSFEELKEELGDKYDRFMYNINKELMKQKIEAIRYIKQHTQKYDIDGYVGEFDEFEIFTSPKVLLKILGGDKE